MGCGGGRRHARLSRSSRPARGRRRRRSRLHAAHPRRRACLQRRGCGLRLQAARSTPGRLRLPRDLPSARDRGDRAPVQRHRLLRAAHLIRRRIATAPVFIGSLERDPIPSAEIPRRSFCTWDRAVTGRRRLSRSRSRRSDTPRGFEPTRRSYRATARSVDHRSYLATAARPGRPGLTNRLGTGRYGACASCGQEPASLITRASSTAGQDGGGQSPLRIAHRCLSRLRIRIVIPVTFVTFADTQIRRCGM
jgi:hypothetical protein